MPRCSNPSRCRRSPRPTVSSSSTVELSRMPARIRASTRTLPTQAGISAEIAELTLAYERERSTGRSAGERTRPLLDYPPYRSSVLRHPTSEPQLIDPEGVELVAPVFGPRDVDPLEA